ncbi:hypothetical protein GCK72_004631 [Caenorhabditis remanei]|uniref:F-box domain-containing protein n=1 Tax=Caenorhabditis remanei TaxID=31234 RepID=A0A6A5HEF4_CAERE|nr:hypothetical protein GCK72_004631 [Caenorhabditis remanei]KAF1764682.1 hypothetical protein GCK72_004631 [Caenorhabditis remanei]
MTPNATKFPLLYLPCLALENVLSNFDHLDRFEFSTCSKRCKRVVKSLRHGRIEIDVQLNHRLTSVTLSSGRNLNEYTWFHFCNEPGCSNHQSLTLNGRTIRMKKASSKLLNNSKCVCFYCSGGLTVNTKALVNHLVEIFRVPIRILRFDMDGLVNYRDYVQCFSKCDDLRICGVGAISEEDLTYLEEHVEHTHFYINGNLQ